MKPRTFTQAKNENWIVKNVNEYDKQVRVDMKPRFGIGLVSFWLTNAGAKRLGVI